MRKDADICLLLILRISGRAVRSTIFDRDRTGEAQELASRIKRIDDQIADLRRGIEQDIRAALLNLKSTADQVPVAQQGQDLSERKLKLTLDRFRSGVTDKYRSYHPKDELPRAPGKLHSRSLELRGCEVCAGTTPPARPKTNIDQYLGNP